MVMVNEYKMNRFELIWCGRDNGGDGVYTGIVKYIILIFKRNFMELLFIRVFDISWRI